MSLPVVFTPRARRQLAAIEAYLAKRFSPANAEKYAKAIYDRCQRLALAPHQGTSQKLRSGLRVTGFDRKVAIGFSVHEQEIRISSISYRGHRY